MNLFSIILAKSIIADMMYIQIYMIIQETTSYIILYISQKVNHILKRRICLLNPKNF